MVTKKRILITGGAGFIGSHVCDALISNDNKLIIVDDLSTGYESNIEHILDKVEFYHEKIEEFDLNSIGKVDGIIHLAAQTSVPLSIEQFKVSSLANIHGFLNVVDFCKQVGIPLIFASSSAIYGNLSIGNDESEEIDLISPYASDKYAMEIYGKMANRLFNLPNIGLRFFNVYGPRQDPSSQYSGVISVFISQMKNKESVTIHGGHQTRDFIYVSDVVTGIILSMSHLFHKSAYNQINLLTGSSTSINELFRKLADILGYDLEPKYTELLLGDPEQSDGTTNKMKTILSLNPEFFVKLDDGLKNTIDF